MAGEKKWSRSGGKSGLEGNSKGGRWNGGEGKKASGHIQKKGEGHVGRPDRKKEIVPGACVECLDLPGEKPLLERGDQIFQTGKEKINVPAQG